MKCNNLLIVNEGVFSSNLKQGAFQDIKALDSIFKYMDVNLHILLIVDPGFEDSLKLDGYADNSNVIIVTKKPHSNNVLDRYFYTLSAYENEIIDMVSSYNIDVALLMGFGASKLAKKLNINCIFLLSLPPDMMFRYKLLSSRSVANVLREIIKFILVPLYYFQIRKSANLTIAQDPNLARRYSFISNGRSVYYPSPLISTGIDYSNVRNNSRVFRIVLVGSRGLHTIAQYNFFVKKISVYLELINEYEYEILIVGRQTIQGLEHVPKSVLEKIRFVSYTAELDRVILESDCVIQSSPIPFGASTRVKHVLMCGGMLLVHKAVTYGVPELKDSENCMVCNDGREFVVSIKKILDKKVDIERIRRNAILTYKDKFSFEKGVLFWNRLLEKD